MPETRVCKTEDFYSFVGLTDPQISADGKFAAVVETRSDTENDSYRYAIRIMELCSNRQAVFDVDEGSIHSLKFSPDGQSIVFIHFAGETGCVKRVSTEEALGDGPRAQFEILLDKPGLSPALCQDSAGNWYVSVHHRTKHQGVRVIRSPHYKQDGGGYLGFDATTTEFYRIGSAVDVEKIYEIQENALEFTVSSDGNLITYTLQPSKGDKYYVFDLWTFELSSGVERKVLSGQGPVTTLTFLPDNRRIVWIGHQSEVGWGDGSKLYMTDLVSSETKELLPGFDRPLAPYAFGDVCPVLPGPALISKQDGTGVWFLATDHGVSSIYESALDAQTPQKVPGTDLRAISRFAAASDGTFVFVASDISQPDALFLLAHGEQSVLHNPNGEALPEVEWAGGMHLKFSGAKDWPMEGWLLLPPDSGGYAAPYPMVMVIHGGPHNSYGYGFEFEFQHLCARGFAVLWMNPRGSQTYGDMFAKAVNGDWGGADFEDLMHGVDAAIKTGFIDPERLGVTGYSYGGYMTNWIVTHTNRFRAAATGGCVSNLVSITGASDVGRELGAFEIGGLPWTNHDLLWSRSPLAHVSNVQTPCLVYHGESDTRCPVGQAEEFFAALVAHGNDTQFVLYPGMSHVFILNGPPKMKADRYRLLAEWFGGRLA